MSEKQGEAGREVALEVGGEPVELNRFVRGFVAGTLLGMVGSLRGVEEVGALRLALAGAEATLEVDGADVELNEFARTIVTATVRGMISALDGVDAGAAVVLSLG